MKKVVTGWVSPLITDSLLTVVLCYVLCSLILCLELQCVCPVNYYETLSEIMQHNNFFFPFPFVFAALSEAIDM